MPRFLATFLFGVREGVGGAAGAVHRISLWRLFLYLFRVLGGK